MSSLRFLLATSSILCAGLLAGRVRALSQTEAPTTQHAADLLWSLDFDHSQATPNGPATAPSFRPELGYAARLPGTHPIRVDAIEGSFTAFSFCCWIRLADRPTSGLAALFAADGWQPGLLHINVRPDRGVEVAVHGQSSYLQSPADTLSTASWVQLAVTYDSSTRKMSVYRNGRVVAEQQDLQPVAVTFPRATLGAWHHPQPDRVLRADIDEVQLWSVALSAEQIRRDYWRGRGLPEKPIDYASEIRPLLQQRCGDCHAEDEGEGGLRIDVRDSMMRGGESGEPAVLPFESSLSEIVRRMTSNEDGYRMPPEGKRLTQIEIKRIATWIDQGAPWPDRLAGELPRERRTTDHWSFQPIRQSPPPDSAAAFVTSGNAIDAFIWRRLESKGLQPSPEADRRTLIRRLFLDVHGVPPTPAEVRRFLADRHPLAWERLVDEVLASPRYGERWASHWLDVIRYGDTHGFEVNTPRPDAWPYRDYVIKSLNEDKPFDQFLREQIAGEQFGADAATGFLVSAPALLPGQIGKDEASKKQARADELHEIIVNVGSGILGLTIGCARCHPHKFDPISQRDYYQLQGCFAGVRYGNRPLADDSHFRLGTATSKTVYAGSFVSPGPTYRLYRGDATQPRERLAPDIPAVFGSLHLESSSDDATRRLALANWLASPDNPLPARVIVNRIWQHHFGRGIVATPSDFGKMGVPPTHPELLDYLAAALQQNGWSLKHIHRLILTSNTYRQASRPRQDALAKDAGSHFLWRYPPHRLEMEAIRDSVLSVSGSMDWAMGGPGFSLFKPNTNYVRVYDPKDTWGPAEFRRMIYAHRVRMERDGVFGVFDCPDAGQPTARRSVSTTPLQALSLLNSAFMHDQAIAFARRVTAEAGTEANQQIEYAFLLSLSREPSSQELADCRRVYEQHGLAAVCLALWNTAEFIRIE